MTYKELNDTKELVRLFRKDKCVYASGDILIRMRDKIAEEMAVIGYTYLEQRGKTIEELFAEKTRALLFEAQRKSFDGDTYIKLSELNNALKTIVLKSIYE